MSWKQWIFSLFILSMSCAPLEPVDAEHDGVNTSEASLVSITDSRVFDARFYLARYADLRRAYGTNLAAATGHWQRRGLDEGRMGAPAFDVQWYLRRYRDLQTAFGQNHRAALQHFLTNGIREGRSGSIAFDSRFYLANYQDLRSAFGEEAYEAAFRHWLTRGIAEGRAGSSELDPIFYLGYYEDLRRAFGAKNYSRAIEHYLNNGVREGRTGSAMETGCRNGIDDDFDGLTDCSDPHCASECAVRCTSTSECSPGLRCVLNDQAAGVCLLPGVYVCQSDDDCAPNQTCYSGTLTATCGPPGMRLCRADVECASNQVCNERGLCVGRTGPRTEIAPGVQYSVANAVHLVEVNLCAAGISVRATGANERGRTVESFARQVGAVAAINGDFFTGNYQTNGLAAHAGTVWAGRDHASSVPVAFGPGRAEIRTHEDQSGWQTWMREVVSGHPSLLVDGRQEAIPKDSLCEARTPRTAVGISRDKRRLFLAVADGFQTNAPGKTCTEMADLMASFGAHDAVNLDGGGSSTLYAGGSVRNEPSDGSPRLTANHLAIIATGMGPAQHCP